MVIVTGGSKGLGLSITKQLLNDGYTVISGSRTETESLSALMAKHPNQLFYKKIDLADIDSIHPWFNEILKYHGTPFGLINNAAIGTDGVLATMHESQILDLIKVNLTAPIVLSKYVGRSFLKRRSGRIINISSIIANTGYSGLSVYAATKAGLIGFTKSLSREMGKYNITVNAICPGYMETEMTNGLPPDKLDSIKRRSALGHLADINDIPPMVSLLLSESGKSITGTSFTIDAGSTA